MRYGVNVDSNSVFSLGDQVGICSCFPGSNGNLGRSGLVTIDKIVIETFMGQPVQKVFGIGEELTPGAVRWQDAFDLVCDYPVALDNRASFWEE